MNDFKNHIHDKFSHIKFVAPSCNLPPDFDPYSLNITSSIIHPDRYKIISKGGFGCFMHFHTYEQAVEVLEYIKTTYVLWI